MIINALQFKTKNYWKCPVCDFESEFATRPTLWSLIPGVHRHLIVDHTFLPDITDNELLVPIRAKKYLPLIEGKLKSKLRRYIMNKYR